VFDDFQTLIGAPKASGHERWFWVVKWGLLIATGVVVALVLYYEFDLDAVLVPHFGSYSLDLLYIPVVIVVFFAGTSGIVITDGMDGLMAGVSAIAFGAYGAIACAGQDELVRSRSGRGVARVSLSRFAQVLWASGRSLWRSV
jgi:UDP-N-acetylmuramyl pentapeptide phosphotransferase/UDP-N-acetylglucosamine-1-phosphate transferase